MHHLHTQLQAQQAHHNQQQLHLQRMEWWRVREDPEDLLQKKEKEGVSNGMASTVVPESGLIVLYGGESAPLDNLESFEYFKVFNTQSLRWRNIISSGDKPERRSWTQMCTLGDRIYLYGGITRPQQTFHSDLYSFRVVELDYGMVHWEKVECSGDIPLPRSSHSLVPIGDQLVLIGGGNWTWNLSVDPPVPIVTMHDDVHTFNTVTKKWIKRSTTLDSEADKPPERWGQTAVAVGNKIYIFGGQHLKKIEWYNDIYSLDTATWQWEKVKWTGTPPLPRHGHTLNYVNGHLFVIGGWGKPDPTKDQTSYFNDVHTFNLTTQHWTKVDMIYGVCGASKGFETICGHCVGLVDNRLYIMGGLTSWSDRTPNEATMMMWIKPKNLKEACLMNISRNWDMLWKRTLADAHKRNDNNRLLPMELEEQIEKWNEVFGATAATTEASGFSGFGSRHC